MRPRCSSDTVSSTPSSTRPTGCGSPKDGASGADSRADELDPPGARPDPASPPPSATRRAGWGAPKAGASGAAPRAAELAPPGARPDPAPSTVRNPGGDVPVVEAQQQRAAHGYPPGESLDDADHVGRF